ncbi:ABC transporter ATP-binding protein [Pontibacter sp. CAU 1760]
MSLLQVSGISMAEGGNTVLHDISFRQEPRQKIAISGETGSGKSTLLKIIAGFIQPTAGSVLFEDDRVLGPHEKLVAGHPDIAYLSQQFELPKSLRVEQVLRYANTLTNLEAQNLYELCRISHLLQRRTDQLSGGERQRIALARLLTTSPKLLLLDEPYSNLDMAHKSLLKAVIQDIGEQLDITCTLISHDPLDTLSWADTILVMRGGKVLQQGSPQHIYRQPVDEYTAALFGAYNLVSAQAAHLLAEATTANSLAEQAIIRPEAIRIEAAPAPGVAAEVKQVRYFGGYTEVEAVVANELLKLRTHTHTYQQGDAIQVAASPEDVWYI